jgi:hypothetical protein
MMYMVARQMQGTGCLLGNEPLLTGQYIPWGVGIKQLWPILRDHPIICPVGLRETTAVP